MASPRRTLKPLTMAQAQAEIAAIKTQLAEKDFKVSGLALYTIGLKGGKSVPETVYNAYYEMREGLRDPELDAVQALALYYAHFRIAVRFEYDHPARNEDTRAFYRELAAKTGDHIFPNNAPAAQKFDEYVLKVETYLAQKRASEQRGYLDFQEKLETEIENTNDLKEKFQSLSSTVEEMINAILDTNQEAKDPSLEQDLQFLGEVIDRMRLATSRGDVQAYAKDAHIILDCIVPNIQKFWFTTSSEDNVDKQIQEFENQTQVLGKQIEEMKQSISTFATHHPSLMTSLKDKKNALYLKSVLEAAAVVSAGTIARIDGGDIVARSISSGIRAGSDAIPLGIEIGSAKLGAGLQAMGEESLRREVLPNVHIPERAWDARDTLTYAVDSMNASLSKPDNLLQAHPTTLLTGLGIAFPQLAIPIAVTLVSYKLGKIAHRAYSQNRLFQAAEKESLGKKTLHEKEMQKYLQDSPQHAQYQERIETWKNQHSKQPDSAARPKPKT